MNMTEEDRLRVQLVDTCRAMNASGINRGTSGNVSARCGDGFLVSPTGVPYDLLTPEMVVWMRMDGTFTGNILPSSEWRFHRDILHSRPEMGAVVHTHSTHATAMAIHGLEIPAIHYSIASAGGPNIRCAPYATFGTQALSDNALSALEGRKACLLQQHGVIAVQRNLERALSLAILVEQLATQYMLCRLAGEPPVLDDEEIARVIEKYKTYGVQPAAISAP